MSEAPSDNALPPRDAPLPPPVEPAAPPTLAKGRSNGLTLLALVFAAAGVALAGWGTWQVRGLEMRDRQQFTELAALREQNQGLSQRAKGLSETLAQLPSAEELAERRRLLASLQGDQQRLSQRLETVLGASRQDWRLAEAEHLLRLASLRLSALQDINSARALVQGADEILREQDDPAAFAAREQLARSLEALRSVTQPDRTGLFLQLGALRQQVVQLDAQSPVFVAADDSLPSADEGRWARWWRQVSSFFRIDFAADQQTIRPLLAGQSLTQVRLALSLALEQAQWAALNGEAAVYAQALAQARGVLDEHFNPENPQSRALRVRLDELGELPVGVATPDLAPTLSAVQAYLQRRQLPSAASEAADLLEPAPELEDPQP